MIILHVRMILIFLERQWWFSATELSITQNITCQSANEISRFIPASNFMNKPQSNIQYNQVECGQGKIRLSIYQNVVSCNERFCLTTLHFNVLLHYATCPGTVFLGGTHCLATCFAILLRHKSQTKHPSCNSSRNIYVTQPIKTRYLKIVLSYTQRQNDCEKILVSHEHNFLA